MIDEAKWADWEYIRLVDTGVYESGLTRHDVNGGNNLNFVDGNNVTAFRADVTVTDVINDNNVWPRARLVGFFYNDGTQGDGTAGEIICGVDLRHHNGSLEGRGWVTRCLSGHCNVTGEFENLELIPLAQGLQLNQTYTLTIAWDVDNEKFLFGLDDLTVSSTITLPPVKGLPRTPFKGVGTRVWVGSSGEGAYITAEFDNVRSIVQMNDIKFPVLMDRGFGKFREYGVVALPSTIMINKHRDPATRI